MKKVKCSNCNKEENEKATIDGICVTCWNKLL